MNAMYELCDIIMKQEKRIQMLEEECAAMREQLSDAYDGQGYGIAAIKPKKKDNK